MQGGSGDAYDLGDRDLGDLLLQEYADFFLLAVELGLARSVAVWCKAFFSVLYL